MGWVSVIDYPIGAVRQAAARDPPLEQRQCSFSLKHHSSGLIGLSAAAMTLLISPAVHGRAHLEASFSVQHAGLHANSNKDETELECCRTLPRQPKHRILRLQSAARLAAMHGVLKAAALHAASLHAAAHLAPIVLVRHVQEVEPWAQAIAVLPEVLQAQKERDTP